MTHSIEESDHFIDVKGQTIAKVQNGTIQHIKCAMLTNDVKCDACTRHRKSLMVKRSRRKKSIKGCIRTLPVAVLIVYVFVHDDCMCVCMSIDTPWYEHVL